jgi:hypothetical protein
MMRKELIAPCGMNCGICKYHFREKNTCPSCRKLDEKTTTTRFHCIIRECKILKEKNWMFCPHKCEHYPCKRLKNLDKRYRTKYHMSMLENLSFIKEYGIDLFLEKERQKWTCPNVVGSLPVMVACVLIADIKNSKKTSIIQDYLSPIGYNQANSSFLIWNHFLNT